MEAVMKKRKFMGKLGRWATASIALLVSGLVGCRDSASSNPPFAPSPLPQARPLPNPEPTTIQLAVFTDPATGFSSADIYDVDDDVIRVSTGNELIWADGRSFPEFIASGNFIAYHHRNDHVFQIRFGTKSGERRAYVTWPDDRLVGAATILDLWIDGRGDLKVAETNVALR